VKDFAGFVEYPRGLDLLYSRDIFFPPKSGKATILSAVTPSTVGQSWSYVPLGCSSDTPCEIFGPEAPVDGGCGMSEWQQSILVGTAGGGISAVRWRAPALCQQ
jgi:hypothetical protein